MDSTRAFSAVVGPKGFTNTFQEFNLTPGGTWQFIMHGPDGTNYSNKSIFDEIVEPERIVFQHVSGPNFQVIATLDDLDGQDQGYLSHGLRNCC